MSPTTIRRCDKSLVEKQYITVVKEVRGDLNSGKYKDTKYYNFVKYNEAVCDAIISHENRLTSIEERLDAQEKREKAKDAYIAKLEKELYNKQIEEKTITL